MTELIFKKDELVFDKILGRNVIFIKYLDDKRYAKIKDMKTGRERAALVLLLEKLN